MLDQNLACATLNRDLEEGRWLISLLFQSSVPEKRLSELLDLVDQHSILFAITGNRYH